MVARSEFGRTWWGEQWLNALSHIDFDNRLPRGRSYAHKGAVRNLAVTAGRIQAKVQGSRVQPYRVDISVPPIAPRDVERLLDRIAADPALIAGMLNRELDPAVLGLASELGIPVFPSRWQDLSMQCSCPDWAVPCKHLAAAIYLLSREIDGNPFLVFSLRGLDLAAALKDRHIHLDAESGAALPTLAELLPTGDERTAVDSSLLDGLDFSLVPELSEPLLRVLPARPPFFAAGDFREIMGRLLARVAKAARQALAAVPGEDTGNDLLAAEDRPCLVFDADHELTLTGVARITDWPALVAALAALAPARLADFQPELATLQPLRLLALHLLARGAVVPQIFAIKGQEVGLRWLPATLDPRVRELMERVVENLPPGRVALRQGRKTLPLSATAQATALCSLFLDHFIHAWSAVSREKAFGDQTLALFFATGRARHEGPGEGSIAAGIHAWLSRFHLARREHAPVLCLGETDDHFELSLAVESSTALAAPVPLSVVLDEAAWAPARLGVLQTISLLAEFLPPLRGHVSAGARTPLPIAAEALPGLLFDTLPALRLLGIRALLPRALDRLLRPRLSLQIKGHGRRAAVASSRPNDIFSLRLAGRARRATCCLAKEFARSGARGHRRGALQGQATSTSIRPRSHSCKPATGPAISTLGQRTAARRHGRRIWRVQPVGLDEGGAGQAAGTAPGSAPKSPCRPPCRRPFVPTRCAATNGWPATLRLGLGSVIADDMGLGKTLQVIALLLHLKERWRARCRPARW
jgi:uncharacterized Zn finger protein